MRSRTLNIETRPQSPRSDSRPKVDYASRGGLIASLRVCMRPPRWALTLRDSDAISRGQRARAEPARRVTFIPTLSGICRVSFEPSLRGERFVLLKRNLYTRDSCFDLILASGDPLRSLRWPIAALGLFTRAALAGFKIRIRD
jgi:hypothetical protein